MTNESNNQQSLYTEEVNKSLELRQRAVVFMIVWAALAVVFGVIGGIFGSIAAMCFFCLTILAMIAVYDHHHNAKYFLAMNTNTDDLL